jgi:hypothetical protein
VSTDADAKRDELMRLVSHYLVYVGQKCLLLPPEWDGEIAIDLAKRKQPAFTWKIMIHPWYMTRAARSAAIEILKRTKCANNPGWAGLASYNESADVMGDMLAVTERRSSHCVSNIEDERGSPSDAVAKTHQGQMALKGELLHNEAEEHRGTLSSAASTVEDNAPWSQSSSEHMVPHTVCTNCAAMILVTVHLRLWVIS